MPTEKQIQHHKHEGNDSIISMIVPPGLKSHHPTDKQSATLQSEQIRLLYSNLPASITVSALLALILAAVQASVVSHVRLGTWLAILALTLVGRGILFIRWRNMADTASPAGEYRLLNWFRVGALAAGIVWGVGGVLLLIPLGDQGHNVYVAFILAGLCAGASVTLAIDRISVVGFLLSAQVPYALLLALVGDTATLYMSAMIVLFLFFVLGSARQSRLQLEENFYLRHRAVENESKLREMLESSPIAARIEDAASKQVVFANNSYISLIDSTRERVIGIEPASYYADPKEYAEVMQQLGKGGHVVNKLVELHSPDGKGWVKWALASYFPVEYQDKPAILGWFYDITDRKLMEEQVKHLAYHDALTGLPNRSLFRDRLLQAIAIAEREKCILALMFIDLDKFKPVNDQYGHEIGDLLLKAVAERMLDCLRKSDSVARVGGDEFIVLLPDIGKQENALEVAENIRRALNRPFEIGGRHFEISSSIGVALYPDHADEERQLIKLADTAMYYAKAEGRNRVTVYHSGMEEQED